jgi:hypothetical protein
MLRAMKLAALAAVALIACSSATASASLPRIRAIVVSGTSGARLAETTGAPRPLAAAIGDGRGGWFTAGANGVIRLRANGTVDAGFAGAGAPVALLARASGVLVTAGPAGLRFLDPATGAPVHPDLPFAPAGTTVSPSDIAASASIVFVVGSTQRARNGSSQLAFAVDARTGRRTAWHPVVRRGVAIGVAAFGSTVYLGGTFKTVGGAPRCGLAAVTTTTGALRPWRSATCLSEAPRDMIATAHSLFLGRLHGLFALRTDSGVELTWSTRVSKALWALGAGSLALSGHTLYVGTVADAGPASIGGQKRAGYLALDTTNGSLKPWQVRVARFQNGKLLSVSGSRVLAYGSYRG